MEKIRVKYRVFSRERPPWHRDFACYEQDLSYSLHPIRFQYIAIRTVIVSGRQFQEGPTYDESPLTTAKNDARLIVSDIRHGR